MYFEYNSVNSGPSHMFLVLFWILWVGELPTHTLPKQYPTLLPPRVTPTHAIP